MESIIVKQSIVLCSLLVASAGVAGIAHGSAVRVENSGFENYDQNRFAGWELSQSTGTESQMLPVAHGRSGRALLLIQEKGTGLTQLTSGPIPVTGKTTYLFSVWVKSDSFSLANVYLSVPQAKVEGKPPSRGEFSGPVQPIYSTEGKWQKLQLYFTTAPDADVIRLKVNISGGQGQLLADDVTLEKLTDEDYKPLYEPVGPEKLASMEETQKVVSQRGRATAEMRRVGDRPRIFIDGKESIPAFYKGTGAWKFASRTQIGDFAKAGVKVYFIPYILGRGVYQTLPTGSWLGPDQYDFSEVDALMWRVLRADPHAYIMFDLSMDPYSEWGAEHPDDVVINEKGEKAIVAGHALRFGGEPQKTNASYSERYGYSYVSARLRKESTDALLKFDEHVRQSAPGKAVIGYFLHGGDDGQMFNWGERSDQLVDYSPASIAAFRGWLQDKYGTATALQKAWGKPDVTFETAEVPPAVRRRASQFFLDPRKEQDIIDYKRFHSEGMIDAKIGYAESLRKAHGSPMLVGTYYAGPTIGLPSHRATGQLLESKQFDLTTSVLQYGATRVPGGVGKAHQAWQSLGLHNTIGIAEEDFRSWKSAPTTAERDAQLVARAETPEEMASILRRDTGAMLANGQGVWWYDMDGGWFSDPKIMKPIKECVEAFKADLEEPEAPKAEVAVFVDEYSQDCINERNTRPFRSALNAQILAMNASGVPYHIYLQSDLDNPNLPEYKLYLFLNAYHLTAKESAAINRLKSNGRTLAFFHAPGIIGADAQEKINGADVVTALTGIAVSADGEHSLALETVAGNLFGETAAMSPGSLTAPAYAVIDPLAAGLASYSVTNRTAVAWRDFGKWKSLFFGGWGTSPGFFNRLARRAGAWVASEPGTAVYGSQKFVVVHALYPGTRDVKLLKTGKVTDLADGKVLSLATNELHLEMKKGETRWFMVD